MKLITAVLRGVVPLILILCYATTYSNEIKGIVKDKDTNEPMGGVLLYAEDYIGLEHSKESGEFLINGQIPIKDNSPHLATIRGFVHYVERQKSIVWHYTIKPERIELYTVMGKKILSEKVQAERGVMRLSTFAKGFYIVNVKFKNFSLRKALINLPAKNKGIKGAPVVYKERGKQNTLPKLMTTLVFYKEGYLTKRVSVTKGDPVTVLMEKDLSAVVFDDTKMNTYNFDIELKDYEWLNNNAIKEEYVPANFSFNGKAIAKVGIRYKGASTLSECVDETGKKICKKLSFKLKFNKYNKDVRFHTLKRLNLHSLSQDNTYFSNHLSYNLFREAGVITSRSAFAKVYINGKYEGLFLATEEMDGRFTKNRFPAHGDGNLYKEGWPCEDHKGVYERRLKTNNGKNDTIDVSKMDAFERAVAAMNNGSFATEGKKWFDLFYLMRYIVVDQFIGNSDGIMTWYVGSTRLENHNYYWYEQEGEKGRYWLFPWDLDFSFAKDKDIFEAYNIPHWFEGKSDKTFPINDVTVINPPGNDKLTRLLASNGKAHYLNYANHFSKTLFNTENVMSKVERWSLLIDNAVKEDQNGHGYDVWKRSVDDFKNNYSYYQRRFDHYKSFPERISTLPPIDQAVSSEYKGLTIKENNFEISGGGVGEPNIKVMTSTGLTHTLVKNTIAPLSGTSDLKYSITYTDLPGDWTEWSGLFFKFREENVDLSKCKYVGIKLKSTHQRTVRISLGSDKYPNPSGILYGWTITVTPKSTEFILPMYKISYPSWGAQKDVFYDIIKSVKELKLEPSPRFDNTGKLIVDPDDCVLQIDDIRFID